MLDAGYEVLCFLQKVGCRHEYALGGTLSGERSHEALDVGAAHFVVRGIALRLNVDGIEAQRILMDDPVDPVDPAIPGGLGHMTVSEIVSSEAHSRQKIENDPLEALGREIEQKCQQVIT